MVQAKSDQVVVGVQSLTKTFKDFWMRTRARAVDGVTFNVHAGEIFGLLGPNGSGKSTTIKIVLGLLKQSSGRVAVFDKPPTDVDTKKRIGYLPEESYLYPFLNAQETLEYYGKLFQIDNKVLSRRIDELLDMVGLNAVRFRQVREYSKGMQRRIGIAQALINDPDLLILDEPTTGLDPIGTRQVKDLILELGRRKKTIILSSHLLADVEDCVDRMVILYGGKIREEGTCDEILSANDRAVIETDPLDEGTIAAIDQVIRERSGGLHAINRVSKGRQKLEEKFVKIVEKAMQERVETSGARHGGRTADFLRAGQDDAASGQRLINDLVARGDEAKRDAGDAVLQREQAAAAASDAAKKSTRPDDAVIAQLTTADVDRPAAVQAAAAAEAKKAAASNVDVSMINSLLGGDQNAKQP